MKKTFACLDLQLLFGGAEEQLRYDPTEQHREKCTGSLVWRFSFPAIRGVSPLSFLLLMGRCIV